MTVGIKQDIEEYLKKDEVLTRLLVVIELIMTIFTGL